MKLNLTTGVILGLVGLGAYKLFSPTANPGSTVSTAEEPATASNTTSATVKAKAPVPKPTPVSRSIYPLEKGSKGNEVRQLQAYLGLTADGIFGAQTENKLLQKTGVSKIFSAEGLRRVLAGEVLPTAIPAAATAQPSVRRVASNKDLLTVFNILWMPIRGRSNFYARSFSSQQSDLVNVLGGYSDKQLADFIYVYFSTYKARVRPGVKSLVSDIKNVIPQKSWSDALTRLVNRLLAVN